MVEITLIKKGCQLSLTAFFDYKEELSSF